MLLGAAPIASLGETTKNSILCANLYQIARKDLLRQHTWNCAIKRVVLAPLVGAPVGGEWAAQFAKPGDWLRTLDVGRDGDDDYVFEGNRILANTTSLILRYVADITEGNWDSLMTDVMVKRMCKDLAYPVTKSASLAQMKAAEYRDALKTAKTVDGKENPPEEIDDSPFLAVRGN